MPRDTYVRIGEAARLAGVSVDTLRRWEREGRLSPPRTFGGQRTYRLADVERLRDDAAGRGTGAGETEQSSYAAPTPRAPASPVVPPWKARAANAEADLTVTRLKIERREEIRRYREEEQRRVAKEQAEAEARISEARLTASRAVERERQQKALDSALWSIRMRLFCEPSEARADVERFLAEHARAGVSVQWITAEVTAILDRRRAERDNTSAREREHQRKLAEDASQQASATLRRTVLLVQAEVFARQQTSDRAEWSLEAANDAIEYVQERLSEAIDVTWSDKRVEREVRTILDDWE